MRDYGDTTNETTYERKTVPFEDPIRMDDAQMNFAYSILKQESNNERVPIDLDGYLEINLQMRQWQQEVTGVERIFSYESTHKCTDQDKEKFFVNPSYEGDFFRDERIAATFKDY